MVSIIQAPRVCRCGTHYATLRDRDRFTTRRTPTPDIGSMSMREWSLACLLCERVEHVHGFVEPRDVGNAIRASDLDSNLADAGSNDRHRFPSAHGMGVRGGGYALRASRTPRAPWS